MGENVVFTQNELVAIFQLCRNYRVGLYTDEYYIIKGIADKIIASGALNAAAGSAPGGAPGAATQPSTLANDQPSPISGMAGRALNDTPGDISSV